MRDLLSGVLSKEDHARMKRKYAQEGRELEERIGRLEKELYRETELLTARNPWLVNFKKNAGKFELTAQFVQALVDRITVYENNRIEIQFKYRDERAILLEALKASGGEVGA